jgi:hypothetical protein
MRYRLRTLLILLTLAPPVLAFLLWAWIRGGLSDALELIVIIAFFAWSVAGIHFAIKQNLGY